MGGTCLLVLPSPVMSDGSRFQTCDEEDDEDDDEAADYILPPLFKYLDHVMRLRVTDSSALTDD